MNSLIEEDQAMKKILYFPLIVLLSCLSMFSYGQTYSENFDVDGNWAGGTMTGYNAKTYTLPSPSFNDHFSTNAAVRETSEVNSGNYAWRVDDIAN